MAGLSANERSARLRSLWAPGLAALICLAILLGLGVWQLARKAEKEALIARIIERSHAEPPAAPPPFDAWDARAEDSGKQFLPTVRPLRLRHKLIGREIGGG